MKHAVIVWLVDVGHAAQLGPPAKRLLEQVEPRLLGEIRLRGNTTEVRVHERDEVARRCA